MSDGGIVPMCYGYQVIMHTLGPMCRYADDLTLMLKCMGIPKELAKLELEKPVGKGLKARLLRFAQVDINKLRIIYIDHLTTGTTSPVSCDMRRALFNVSSRKLVNFRFPLLGDSLLRDASRYAVCAHRPSAYRMAYADLHERLK